MEDFTRARPVSKSEFSWPFAVPVPVEDASLGAARAREWALQPPLRMHAEIHLLTGSIVVIDGLKAKPELNGKSAKVKGFIAAADRYNVLPVGLNARESVIAVKRTNLKQDAAARLPSAEEVDDESEYPLADVVAVLDVLDSLAEYVPSVAIACLTRCVKALMEEAGEIPPERALRAACNALRANARANYQHRELCVAPAPTP